MFNLCHSRQINMNNKRPKTSSVYINLAHDKDSLKNTHTGLLVSDSETSILDTFFTLS